MPLRRHRSSGKTGSKPTTEDITKTDTTTDTTLVERKRNLLPPYNDADFEDVDIEKGSTHESEFGENRLSTHSNSAPAIPAYTPPKPSIQLLFSFISRRDAFVVLLPSCFVSIIAGGVAPFMTHVLGQGFDAFSRFAISTASTPPTNGEKNKLLHDVGIASFELLALAAGAVALSCLMSSLWILVGERNVLGLRRWAYDGVVNKEMEWFDLNMRANLEEGKVDEKGADTAEDKPTTSGAAGMMAKFAKETDEVRMASSLPLGIVLQNITTVLACLALAFRGSWSLTLIIFSTIPLMIFIQSLTAKNVGPYLNMDRNILSQCADHCERGFGTIGTVKGFNAEDRELDQLEYFLDHLTGALRGLYKTYAISNGTSQFISMTTFVTGFWFGAHLVRSGQASAGGVMSVFWACLIAVNNLQLAVPHLATLGKGIGAMIALRMAVETPIPLRAEMEPPIMDDTDGKLDIPRPSKMIPLPNKQGYGQRMQLRKIIPSLPAKGSFVLRNITFAYPTRPLQPVLKDVSLFLPANEMTFIVGSSGSGKSTIGSLLMRLYDPQYGVIEMDDQDLSHLDPAWLRANIFPVEQKVVLFEGSVHQNVAMALEGSAYRRPGEESRAEVIAACRASLMHEFVVEELADGYDTIIGHGKGTDLLSGGQKQRLGIARARLRDPAVLILDECTSSLDPTTRSLIFSAIRLWRRNRTTIVITHDLSMIGKGDFVYVMKAGKVVEQGYRGDLEGRGEFGRMSHVGVPEKDNAEMETIGEADVEDDKSRHAIDIWADNDNSLGVNGFPVAGTRSVSRQSGNVFQGWNFANAWKENNPNSSSSDPNSSGETQVSSSLAIEHIAPNKRWSPLPPARPRPPSRQLLQPSPNSSEDGAYREQGRAISISIPSNAFTHENRISIHSRQPIAQPSSATSIQFHRPMAATPVVSPPLTGQPPSIPPLSHLAAQFLSQHSRPPSFAPSRRDRGSVISQTETVIGDVDGEVMVMDDYPDIVDEDDEFDEDKAALQRTALAASHHRNTFYSTSDPEMPPKKSITREMRLQSLSMQRERELSISQHGGKRPSSTSTNGTKVGKHNSGTLKKKHSKRPSEVIDAVAPAALPTMIDEKDVAQPASIQHPSEPDAPLREVLWRVYKSAPKKFLLFLGAICCLLSGAVTPIFSFILSKLLVEVSLGAHDKSVVNLYGGIILAIAFADGMFMGLKFFIMQMSAVYWVQEVRKKVFMNVLKQDKKWFDRGDHGAEKLVQTMFKDGEDAQQLIGQILGQSVVVIAMLGLGLIWALVLGWQLTLAGFAIAPIFAGVMSVQATLVESFARRNKDCREEVAKGYYETISNIRSIRSMAFERIFRTRYEKSLTAAMRAGVKGAFVEGCNMGVASGLIYLAEALLFWVGAVLVAREIYSYAQMVQVLQLVVFSVSIASQLLAFTGGINKAIQATRDLDKLLTLDLKTEESHGKLEPAIEGNISFRNVSFSYPERPTVPVLRGLNLDIHKGECIAIVGGSGSGKSTIIALLQRLYNPTSGKISVEGTDLGETGVAWLRDNISIVSQNPHLFDMTVIDNIAYGSRPISDEECYAAAQACNADEFILDLPDAYETQLGANADLLSGGQAQRIAIARALVRGAKVLILDECTSALDPENQAFVMESIRKVKSGRTVIIVTHKLPVMRMCDRIVVVDNGVVAEEGTYDSLVERRGVFAQLASGGEWDP